MIKNFAANLKIGAVMGSSVGRVFQGVNKRIKGQESELKRLRAAYKEASKGTGEYAGKLDQLQREIAQTESALKRLRAASKFKLGESLSGVGSKLRGDATRLGLVGGVIGGVGLGIGKNMLDITAAFEKALASLETVEGGAEKAQKSFEWIKQFAATTPYELSELTDSFIKLKAYGLDPIRGDTLRILGDTASATGKDLMQAVEAIADATIGENARLKEAFSIDGDIKGDKIYYTYTDKLLKQRTVAVQKNNKAQIQSTLLAILNDRYKGAMAKQAKTWNGMVSNMKDTWSQFAYMIMQSGPFEMLKGKMQGFLDQLGIWAKDGTMKAWAEKTGKYIVRAGEEIEKFAKQFWTATTAVKDFLGGWDRLAWALVALNFAPTIVAIGSMIRGLWGLATALWATSGASWAVVGPWAILGALIAGFVAILMNLDTVGEFVYGIWEKIAGKEIVDKFWNFVFEAQLAFEEFAIGFVKLTQGLMKSASDLWELTKKGASEAANLIRSVFESVLNWLGEKFDMIGQKIAGIFAGAKSLGNSVMEFFGLGSTASTTTAPALTPAETMPARSPNYNQSNSFNINVTAPGGDGRRIADSIRSEFNRKPLYDMDSFMSPATP